MKTLRREQYEKLRESIRRYGFFAPVFVWQGKILDGHQRVNVLREEGGNRGRRYPFLGSGSTLLAAEKTNRICYGPEIEPRYCDVIVRRWQDYTGEQAILVGDGRTFAEIAEERHATRT